MMIITMLRSRFLMVNRKSVVNGKVYRMTSEDYYYEKEEELDGDENIYLDNEYLLN